MRKSLIYVFLFCFSALSNAQIEMKKLVRNVTNNSENEVAPFLTMDGSRLIYTRKRAMDDHWRVQMSSFEGGTWTRPTEVKLLNEQPKLRLLGAYAFNHNGTELMYTTKKYGGIGNYDLWTSSLKNGVWTKAVNLGKPVNSLNDDINPVFGVEQNTLYFIRRSADQVNGDLYEARFVNNYWQATKKINLGPEKFFAARIAADNQTMYLSQKKGELTALYVSKRSNNSWTQPKKATEFGSEYDSYFGIDQTSTDLLVSAKKDATYDLFSITLPKEHQSVPVTDLSIQLDTRHLVEITKTSDPNFRIRSQNLAHEYLLNDGEYVIQILSKHHFPMVKVVDLSHSKPNQITLSPELTPLEDGVSFLDVFEEATGILNDHQLTQELDALNKTASINPDLTFELKIYQSNIGTDTIHSSTYHTPLEYPQQDNITKAGTMVKKFSNDNRANYLARVQGFFKAYELDNLTLSIEQDQHKFLSAPKPYGLAILVQ